MNKKLHWFLISFSKGDKNGDRKTGSFIVFRETKNFKESDIYDLVNHIKKSASCNFAAILTISYLGEMTEEEFRDN